MGGGCRRGPRGLTQSRRESYAELMSSFPDVTWISNEGAGVIPSITEQVAVEIGGRTIIAVNGRAVALAGHTGRATKPSDTQTPSTRVG